MMLFKLKAEAMGGHVHVDVFVGPDSDHLAKAGNFVLRAGEWNMLGVVLRLGELKAAKEIGFGVKVVIDESGNPDSLLANWWPAPAAPGEGE